MLDNASTPSQLGETLGSCGKTLATGECGLHQLGDRVDLELFHDLRPVGFNRLDADVEFLGDLAVHPARHYQLEHLALALRELREAPAMPAPRLVPGARLRVALEALLDQ